MSRIEITIAENVRRYQRFEIEIDEHNADLARDIDDLDASQVKRLVALADVVVSERTEASDQPEANVMVDALDGEQCFHEYDASQA